MKKLLVLFLVLLVSCVNENLSPEAALTSFVEGTIGKVVTRDFILERVTGKMRASFENMNEEEFAKFSDLRNIDQNSFKILTKSCQENKCFVTYSIGFKTSKEDKAAYKSEVKKIAEIVKVEGKWLISDVSNIKTYHEVLEPINP